MTFVGATWNLCVDPKTGFLSLENIVLDTSVCRRTHQRRNPWSPLVSSTEPEWLHFWLVDIRWMRAFLCKMFKSSKPFWKVQKVIHLPCCRSVIWKGIVYLRSDHYLSMEGFVKGIKLFISPASWRKLIFSSSQAPDPPFQPHNWFCAFSGPQPTFFSTTKYFHLP